MTAGVESVAPPQMHRNAKPSPMPEAQPFRSLGQPGRGSNTLARNPWSLAAHAIACVHVGGFFAAVEQSLNPRLRGKPVVIVGDVVVSASREARRRGVHNSLRYRDVLRACPNAILLPARYEQYAEFSGRVRSILEQHASKVETAAVDEFYCAFRSTGVSGNLHAALQRLQAEILWRTGLSASIGAGRSKMLAKMAIGLAGPGEVAVVAPCAEEAFLSPLLVTMLPGVDATLATTLRGHGISKVGQLRQLPKALLIRAFGEAAGTRLWAGARGLDGTTPPLRDRVSTLFERLRDSILWRSVAGSAGFPAAISSPDTA